MRYFHVLVVVTATIACFPHLACAQGATDYPARLIRIIVSSAPGAGADLQARFLASKLSESMKQPFVIENRPGAGDTIGTGLAAKSAPDGYTLMVASASFTIAPALYPTFPVDPIKDFAPISVSTRVPYLLSVHPALPVKSVRELIALAKSKPGALYMGITNGSINHLGGAYFASMANIKVTLIPYKSTAITMTDIMTGQIHMFLQNFQASLPHVKSGRLKGLAVSTAERSSALPGMPTVSESGVPGYDVSAWYGWLAPTGVPASIVNKLNAEIVKTVRLPDIAKRMADDGAEPFGSTPEQFGQLIVSEVARWGKVVKDLNIRVE
jgi:tripartite-type tricarboxylate transporter receptor subunit TctC